MQSFSRSADTVATIEVPAAKIFAFLDDHKNLSAHMATSSWMMLGSRMEIYLDVAAARSVGSKFGFKGAILGIPLAVDEVVTQREPAQTKVWETIGEPKLWVIGRYRMGFEITPAINATRLRVFIEYALPQALPTCWAPFSSASGLPASLCRSTVISSGPPCLRCRSLPSRSLVWCRSGAGLSL